MDILAIDPGTEQSAWVLYDAECGDVAECAIEDNSVVLEKFRDEYHSGQYIAIEMVACYGMPVGSETFETCVWIGRFLEAFGGGEFVYRRDVKMELCNSVRAKDANVRQALLDRFPATGGGKTPQVGTKSKPGPLYGVKSDIWAALGVAVTYAERLKQQAA